MTDVKNAIRHFILENYLQGELPSNVRDDTRLLSSGILDSLATLGVAAFVERTFGIELTAQDMNAGTFDRIEDIARLVERKRASIPLPSAS